jgi:hypothetical protein
LQRNVIWYQIATHLLALFGFDPIVTKGSRS